MARKQREFNGKIFSDDGSGKLYNAELKKYLIYRPYPLMVDEVSESYVEPDNKQEYTSKELKNKFGTDNTDIINTGKEVEERVSKKIEKESVVVDNAPDEIIDHLYDETGRDKIAQSEIDDYIDNVFLDNELSDYQAEKEEYEEVYKELEKRGYEIDYDKMSQEGLDDVARSELSDEEYSLYEKTKPSDDPYGVKSMLTEDLEQTEYDFTEESLNNPERKAVEEELVKRYEEEGDKVKYSQSFHLESPVNDIDEAQDYLSSDDMTQFVPDELKGVISKAEWVLDDEESGNINIETTRQLTQYEQAILSDWISGQNSDGLGEGFEQQDFSGGYYDPDSGEGPYTYNEVVDIVSRNYDNMDFEDYQDYLDQEDIRHGLENYLRDGYYDQSFEDFMIERASEISDEADLYGLREEFENTSEDVLHDRYYQEYEDWLDSEEESFINSGYAEEYIPTEAISYAKDEVAKEDPRYNENLWEDSMSSIKSDRPGFRSEFINDQTEEYNVRRDNDDSYEDLSDPTNYMKAQNDLVFNKGLSVEESEKILGEYQSKEPKLREQEMRDSGIEFANDEMMSHLVSPQNKKDYKASFEPETYAAYDLPLYHNTKAEIEDWDAKHFGENSLGGLAFGDGLYVDEREERVKGVYGGNTYESEFNGNMIDGTEYNKLINDYIERTGKNPNASEIRKIMLENGIDSAHVQGETIIYNLNKLSRPRKIK